MTLIIFMYALWSSVFAIGKATLAYTTPLFLTGSRMVAAGILLMLYLWARKQFSLRLTRAQWISLGLLGFFNIYLSNLLEFWGLQFLTSAKACFIYSLSPFCAALFSYLHFKEKMTPRKWLGLSIGFFGIMPVVMMQTGSEHLLSLSNFFTWPTLALMGAAVTSVYGWVLLRVAVKDNPISPPLASSVSMVIGGSLALFHSFFVDSWTPVPVQMPHFGSFLQGGLLIMLISNIICFNIYGTLLRRYTATLLSFVGMLSPIFATLHGWIFLNESPSWLILLSTTILSLGMWLVYSSELRQGYVKESKKKN
jgi:drug/metabolite transporter (DMT)-like permease